MKVKNILLGCGLAAMAIGSFSLAAALGQKRDLKAANADAPSWMFRVYLSAMNYGDDNGLSNYRFHCWGDGNDTTVQMAWIGKNVVNNDHYAANVSFTSAQTITGCQFIATKGGADFYSEDISFALTSATNTNMEYRWSISSSTLENAKWSVTENDPDTTSGITINFTDHASAAFVPDPANNVFRVENFTIADGDGGKTTNINSRYLEFNSNSKNYDFLYTTLDADSKESYIRYGANQWASFREYGTYDFILCGSAGFSGLRIHKHADSVASYIYYVSDSADATNNNAYTFGGTQQLGAWPGTKITEIAGVQEVTGGVVHFQGNNVRIYKIPLNIGGTDDDQIIFNYNGSVQTANLYMKPGTALWWSNEFNYTNDQAGLALDLIVRLESIRNAVVANGDVKAYSVCGISKANALSLVNEYLGLAAVTRTNYVDNSTVLTYKRDLTDGNEMVSYYDIMVELAKIAEVSLSSNRTTLINNNNALLVVAIIGTVTIVSFAGLFFIIRRKRLAK